MNVLNKSFNPVPDRSNSYNNILKFIGRKKYITFANLSLSYFQVKVAKRLLGLCCISKVQFHCVFFFLLIFFSF